MIKVKLGKVIPYMKGVFPAMRNDFLSELPKSDLGQLVNESIEAGISPVAGQGRFKDYSASYKAQIDRANGIAKAQKKYGSKAKKPIFAALGKKVRPVNLHLTGDMLASQKLVSGDKGATLSYSDKKAVYHNDQGAGKSKVLRRMIPNRNGETFSRAITRRLRALAAASAAKILGR